ncbi:hypothetical protein HAX54_013475, partial [Datura stramonium]|nr:hypothetical protein [Datura stramonium]
VLSEQAWVHVMQWLHHFVPLGAQIRHIGKLASGVVVVEEGCASYGELSPECCIRDTAMGCEVAPQSRYPHPKCWAWGQRNSLRWLRL